MHPTPLSEQASPQAGKAGVRFHAREQWLAAFVDCARPHFVRAGAKLPDKVRLSIGFTAGGRRAKALGQCWSEACSADGSFEIFIVPSLDDASRIADILTHELVHAAVGIDAGHGPAFRRVAKALGLTGKMTATVAGEEWHAWADTIVADLGPLPHARLDTDGKTTRKKQSTRLLKCECDSCGFVFRASAKWVLDGGPLRCPDPDCDGEMDVTV